jgi:membrane carboxypeptidase/penicillin-binding protein
MLNKGDVIQVRIETLDANSEKNLKGYKPIKDITIPAGQVWKEPGLEGALFSYRVTNSGPNTQDRGAVISMVGGYDFARSEYNRATQAQRQVGSTFKPVVYSAGIESKKFTVASLIPDAPLTYQTFGDKLWKPGNYGDSYSETGYLSLRQALQKSKNVCTIRILDEVNLESIFDLAGTRLRIGYNDPLQTRKHLPMSEPCSGTTTPSPVDGMQWCETVEPDSCPLVRANQKTIMKHGQTLTVDTKKECLNEPIQKDGEEWCRSCDVNLRVCDWLPIDMIPETDPCVDARLGKNGIMCRTCDLSMGLGSSSLTMVELVQAYSAFATYGTLVEPYFIESVKDRDGTIIEQHIATEPIEVINPTVAGITNWLLVQVATGGTAAKTNRLKLHLAGKTGTTNDFFDAWFVGYNPDILTASWVGYDTPKSMGQTFTGGDIALPMWMTFMREAIPEEKDRPFPPIPNVTWATINEANGQLASDGRRMPFLSGTEPTNIMGSSSQKTIEDLLLGDF